MPRRRHPRTFDTSLHRSASESPSPSSGTRGGGSGSSSSAPESTVNERLARLRRETSPRLSRDALASLSKMATAPPGPPELRALLDIPDAPQPPPRDPRRRRLLLGGRIPGPAAPPSWLGAGAGGRPLDPAREPVADPALLVRRRAPPQFSNLAMQPLGSEKLPGQRSLAHYALKSMAVNWEFVSTYEMLNLKILPLGLRSSLLVYISRYGPDHGVDLELLRRIFVPSDAEFLRRLDLTGLLDAKFNLHDVLSFITVPFKWRVPSLFSGTSESASVSDEPRSSTSEPPKSPGLTAALENLTWEEQADAGFGSYSLFSGVTPLLFRNITHLGLGNPGIAASWSQLLHIGPDLARVTHFSLANWPQPELTPNSHKVRIAHNHMNIPAGGTHLYSELHDDWSEAANVLRRLSKFTYCLKWLDLSGCNRWLPALIWTGEKFKTFAPFDPNDNFAGPDWNDSWSQVTYVNVAQGTVPSDINTIRSLPSGMIACELLIYLRSQGKSGEDGRSSLPSDQPSQSEHLVRQWLETEKTARVVRNKIRQMRSHAKGQWCEFDHGWDSTCGFVEDKDPTAAEGQDAP
jgi:hypothetical protein